MEIKRRFDLRKVVMTMYFLALGFYLMVGFLPAKAANYEINATLKIPSIDLNAEVTKIFLNNRALETPDEIVGSFTRANHTLLIGHSSTVFRDLHLTKVGDEIYYNDKVYKVESSEIMAKSDIDMNKLMADQSEKVLTIMTCAGEDLGHGDATERLIIKASLK